MKRKTILFTLLILFSVLNNTVFAQALSGYVYEQENENPLSGISVYIPELMRGSISNEKGYFEFKNIKAGTYYVQISAVGYSSKTIKSNIPQEEVLNIHLNKSNVTIDEIVVSGARTSRKEETPFQIESISKKEISESGNIGMMDALSERPGIDQISFGSGIGKPVIRGLSFSRIMTIYRGMRFENQQWGEDHGIGLDNNGIDRIEVIKGPASLIYGSGALGGVINLIDEKPAISGKIEGDYTISGYSNSLGLNSSLGIKGTGENGFFWILRKNIQNHADYKSGTGRTIGNSRFSSKNINLDFGIIRNHGSSRFSYTYSGQKPGIISDTEMQESLATSRNDRKMQLPFQNLNDHIFTLQNKLFFKASKLYINLGHHINLREEIETAFDTIDLGLRLSTSSYDIKYLFSPHSKGEYTIGFQGFLQNNKNYEGALDILMPDAWLYDNSIFALVNYDLGKWKIQAGGRYDYRKVIANDKELNGYILPGNPKEGEMNRSFSGFSGSAGLTFIPNKNMYLKGNLSSGFRAPDLAELFSNGEHPGTTRFEKGNENFQREQNLEADLSYHINSSNFSFDVAGFYNYISNYIYFSPTGEQINDLNVWQFQQDNAMLYGGESGFRIHPESLPFLKMKSSFSYVRGKRTSDQSDLPLIPANKFFTEIKLVKDRYKFMETPFLAVRMNNVMAQNRIADDELRTPAYHLLHFSVGANFPLGKFSLNVQLYVHNLLNKTYFDHIALTRPFGIHNMGRNFRLNVGITF
ncbi:MAG: TonB-dependent receptor [Chitinophagales bacterium]